MHDLESAALAIRQMESANDYTRQQDIRANGQNDRKLGAYGILESTWDGLTVSLAREFEPDGIRVNAIAPGFVQSDAAKTGLSEEHKALVVQGQITKHVGQIEDLIGTALLLCSEATAFVNGQTWFVDGGWQVGL